MKFAILIGLLGVMMVCGSGAGATETPLTEYVWRPDMTFAWNVSTDTPIHAENWTVYNLYLTSQQWLTPSDSDAHIWRHWVQVCIPKNRLVDSETGLLWIDGGRTKRFNQPPGDIDFILARACTQGGVVTAGLYQIPNEPVVFAGDPTRSRTEDAMIAYTWAHYVNDTMEPDWLARCPMTKASIKAMDAVQDFIQGLINDPNSPYVGDNRLLVPQKFIAAGASKRGWTAWMTGCMGDPRLIATVPVVAPIPNLVPQMNEMFSSYGTYSFALIDYVDVGLMPGFLNEPVFQELLDIIDPLTYGEEMSKVPKYVVVAAGDEFFMPDSARYYWEKLAGEKHLRVVPNAEHSMAGSVFNVIDSAVQFGLSFVDQEVTRPTYSWDISGDGQTITVSTTTENLVDVRVWYSRNNTRRDWRLVRCVEAKPECVNPAFFASKKLEPVSPGVYEYTLEAPAQGRYSAFMIELRFDLGNPDSLFKVTSDLSIVPLNEYPFPPCPDTTCKCGWDCPDSPHSLDDASPAFSSPFDADVDPSFLHDHLQRKNEQRGFL